MQCQASRKEIDNTKQIIFYALCVLYVLSVALVALETGGFVATIFVSNKGSLLFFLFFFFFQFCANQLCRGAQTDDFNVMGNIARSVLYGCCDFIAQSILVRTTEQCLSIPFIYLIFKDTPLLDCVGLQHPCGDHSLHFSICMLRSVNLSWLARWPWLIASSYVDNNLSSHHCAKHRYLE